ncbi:hypothetical protein FKW77_010155 [Venturia effusa]|uniref:Uncharacterized protein n=1 Tax=Venturia effusa TaxID=50376 RepID=A0A517L8C4_9PEZI|nr:hypothetical protein FKW77_010155 [Venturia effusa]
MVNPAQILAAIGGHLEKRDSSSSWTTSISTSYSFVTEPTTVTVGGYYDSPTPMIVEGAIVVSSDNYTDYTRVSWATSPLTATTALDPSCSTDYTVWDNGLEYVTGDDPIFSVGAFTLQTDPSSWYCESYLNPLLSSIRPAIATIDDPITSWTVTARYTTVTMSTSTYNTPVVSGTAITTIPRTSSTMVGTASLLTIISGAYGATFQAPILYVRWQTTDQVVLAWRAKQPGGSIILGNSTANDAAGHTPPSSPSPVPKLSGGAIAGIVIGAVVIMTLLIGGVLLCLWRKKRQIQRQKDLPSNQGMAEHVHVQPKSYNSDTSDLPHMSPATDKPELDSRPLSIERFLAYNKASSSSAPHTDIQPHASMSPKMPELPVKSVLPSIATNTLHESSRSPVPQQDNQGSSSRISSSVPETDMLGSSTVAPGRETTNEAGPGSGSASPPPSRSTWLEQQQRQVKEEKARLNRLQELSEMEARLEEQLQRELAEELS